MRKCLFLLALSLCASPAFAQDVNESIAVGTWVVRRVQEAGGGIQTCVAANPAEDKSAVGFGGTNADKGFVMLIDPTAKWQPGKEYAFEYKVDGGKTTKTTAFASSGTTLIQVIGSLNDVGPFFTAVEGGNTIHLETDTHEYDYSLSGSKVALAALEKCLLSSMNK